MFVENMDYILVPLLFTAADIVSGVLCVLAKDGVAGLSSTKAREGLMHKVAFVLVLALGVLIDYAETRVNLGITIPVGGIFAAYISATEMVSIYENIRSLNPNLPATIAGITGEGGENDEQ